MRPAATAAAVGHARCRSRVRGPGEVGTRGASGQAALGCTRQGGGGGKRERKREERFAATIATGCEEKERRVRSVFEIG